MHKNSQYFTYFHKNAQYNTNPRQKTTNIGVHSCEFVVSLEKNKANSFRIAYCVMRTAKTNLQNKANLLLLGEVALIRVHSWFTRKNKANYYREHYVINI